MLRGQRLLPIQGHEVEPGRVILRRREGRAELQGIRRPQRMTLSTSRSA